MIYGPAFSKEVIDSEVLTPVPPHLFPWLKVQLKELTDEEMPKAKSDLKKVANHLMEMKNLLKKYEPNTAEYIATSKKIKDAEIGIVINNSKLSFYESRIYLMNKRLNLK